MITVNPGTILKGRMDDIGFYHQVLIDELRRVGVVGVDTPYFGCYQIDLVEFFLLEKSLYFRLAL